MMTSTGVQAFLYPEELEHVGPRELAAQVLELGLDSVSVAVSYHRGRRVFPRHRRVSVLARRALYIVPDRERYGSIQPPDAHSPELAALVLRFRDACADAGVSFRAWVVALHDEELAAAYPAAASRLLDGSPAEHGLCPSAPESIEYVAALAADVTAQLAPEFVDLEAALYSAWEPSYSLTLALEPLSERAQLLGSQCFCDSCRSLLGHLEGRVLQAAGTPFADGDGGDGAVLPDLAAARSAGVRRLLAAVASAVHGEGSRLRVFVSGPSESARVRGASAESLAAADALLFGCGPLRGDALADRFADLRAIAGRTGAVSTNWTPERSSLELGADAGALAGAGADGLALYNLSLVPDRGLDAFRAAAASFRAGAPGG